MVLGISRVSASPLRVGGIDYLNALPLVRYLADGGEPPLRVTQHLPSALAAMLRNGRLDLALAPVVEYPGRDDYRLVPGICISSYGAVESIRLYHSRPLPEVKVVGLDTSSRSSALLLRLLFRDLWRVEPRFMPLDPGAAERRLEGGAAAGGQAAPPEGEPEALLLIGDRALCRPRVPGWEVVDLGTEWTRWTGLPFVYALWIWRGAEAPAGLVARLQEAKRVGIARIDDIVASLGVDGAAGLGAAGCRDYLRRVIQYDLDAPQIEGMLAFFSLLERNGLTAAAPRPLLFLEP